jgi:hypothetical protein
MKLEPFPMTTQSATSTAGSTYRSAGRAAISSGAFGIVALALLIVGVNYMITSKAESSGLVNLMFKAHAVGVIFQSLFMIPVALVLDALARQQFPNASRATLSLGVVSLSFIVLCELLWIVNVVADDLYTVPQGTLGVWLMVVNRRLSGVLPRGLAWFGVVVGIGLLLVGTFPLAYGIFVDPIALRGPVPPDYPSPPFTTANTIIHGVFYVGTLLGVITYPIWSILLGRRLLRARGF